MFLFQQCSPSIIAGLSYLCSTWFVLSNSPWFVLIWMELTTDYQHFVYMFLITVSSPYFLCVTFSPANLCVCIIDALFLHWYSMYEITLCWYCICLQNVLGQKDSRMDQWTWRSTFGSNIFEWQGKFIRMFEMPNRDVLFYLTFLYPIWYQLHSLCYQLKYTFSGHI